MMVIWLSLVICHLSSAPARAQHYDYTAERPLVIACDWDFQPFEFMNANGQPAGYNVEVLDKILTQMNIPHKFVMHEWHTVTELFANHKADIIHGLSYYYKGHPYVTTKKFINYYTLCAARHIGTPPLNSFRHLTATDTLLLKEDDYAALAIKAVGNYPFVVKYVSPKTALSRIMSGSAPYFVWGELPMKRKITELRLDSIVLDEIDLPAGELRIIGYDHNIISLIDEEFTRLEQAGEIQPIYDRWFHPELEHDNESPWVLYLLAGIVVTCLVAFIFSRVITIRVRRAVRQSADLNSMMIQALSMGEYTVLEYDLKTHRVRNRHGHLVPDNGMAFDEFITRMASDERQEFQEHIEAMERGDINQWHMVRHWNIGTDKRPDWHVYDGRAILERELGRPRYIFHTVKDITRDVAEEKHNEDLAAKYQVLFETNILAMSFYDRNGYLLESNQKMRELSGFDQRSRDYFKKTCFFEIPTIIGDFDPLSRDPFYVCQHAVIPEAGIDRYFEHKFMPLYDEDDQLLFYIVTTRDITEERQMYLDERNHEQRLVATNDAIRRYDRQLSYLLEESKMYVWHYNPKADVIHVSRKPQASPFHESLNEFMEGVPEHLRAKALILMREHIASQKPFNDIFQYNFSEKQNSPTWFSVSAMPTFDANGQLTEYFGLARDISQLMAAQQLLRQETARAEDSGRLKSAFLANMTHEIRTPLNAIVGFSELLQMIDEPGERLEFIRIIRNNCDMLLRLINDILEASNMSQSLAIEPKTIDLAPVFDDICRALEQRVQEPGVTFQKDNPYQSYTATIDSGRLQQLLTNFVTNAAKYTHEGHIRVGYRDMRQADIPHPIIKYNNDAQTDGLYFYCQDTGAGIPKEKQASVFERFVKLNDFVQGTGLGLSICRAIVEKCGGHIGVESEGEGHGSTFWFWIPRNISLSSPSA